MVSLKYLDETEQSCTKECHYNLPLTVGQRRHNYMDWPVHYGGYYSMTCQLWNIHPACDSERFSTLISTFESFLHIYTCVASTISPLSARGYDFGWIGVITLLLCSKKAKPKEYITQMTCSNSKNSVHEQFLH